MGGHLGGWSNGWGGQVGGVKWMCSPSVYVWSNCVAKVCVCVFGLSVCGC